MDSVRKVGVQETPESVVGAPEKESLVPQPPEQAPDLESEALSEAEPLESPTEAEPSVVGAPKEEQAQPSNEIPVVGAPEVPFDAEAATRDLVTQLLMNGVEVPLLDGTDVTVADQFKKLQATDNAKAAEIIQMSEPMRADIVFYKQQNQNSSSSTVVERDMYNLLMKADKFVSRKPRMEKIFELLFNELNKEYIQQVILQMAESLSKALYPDLYIDAYDDAETPLATAA